MLSNYCYINYLLTFVIVLMNEKSIILFIAESLEIVGSQNFYRHSNINFNNLTFDLTAFKNL